MKQLKRFNHSVLCDLNKKYLLIVTFTDIFTIIMPSRASSSSASPAVNASDTGLLESLRCQCGEMCTKLQGVGGMSWALLAVVTVYIALVNPSNTPAFFSNTWFKLVLFAFVIVVFVLEGPLVGTMFAIAMVLPVVYSSLREGYENPFIERYEDLVENGTEEKTQKQETEETVSQVVADENGQVEEVDVEAVEDAEDVEDPRNEEKDVKHVKNDHDNVQLDQQPGGVDVESWCNYASVF